jgi:hypothetical protein
VAVGLSAAVNEPPIRRARATKINWGLLDVAVLREPVPQAFLQYVSHPALYLTPDGVWALSIR